MKGNLANLVPAKKFGFIRAGEVEYFFHRDDFNGHFDDLCLDWDNKKKGENIELEFEPTGGAKGPRAKNVGRVNHPNAYR